MSKYGYFNDLTQKERQAVVRNDTLYARAKADFDLENRGRFAKPEPPRMAEYPPLPPSSPWHSDPLGVEPPLGMDINAIEPCGTVKEIEESIARLAEEERGSDSMASSPVLSSLGVEDFPDAEPASSAIHPNQEPSE